MQFSAPSNSSMPNELPDSCSRSLCPGLALLGVLGGLARNGGVFALSTRSIVRLALIVIELTLTFVAASTLRRFYSPMLRVRNDHQLITYGLYRFVRHPFYTGAGLATVGILIYASSLYGLLILLALVPLLVNRIRIEENLLTAEFGDAHRVYVRGTKKLIPFIY